MRLLVSLHTNTEYSFLESTIKIDSLVNFAKNNGLKELVITDHNSMFGVADFIYKCNKNNIKPIIGLDLDVKEGRIILLAKNYEGYQNLCELSSKKMRNNEISINEINAENLFLINHPTKGLKTKPELNNYYDEEVFVVETRILDKSENEAIKIIDSLKSGSLINDDYDYPGYTTEFDESNPKHKLVDEIVKQCNVVFPHVSNPVPHFENPDGTSSNEYIKKIIKKNAEAVLKDKPNKDIYVERIKYELSIIEKLGYEDYFLIIWDLIKWSRDNNILIGPGRGSAAGSLISYILKITEIDPIEYDLLFERFLNPERVTMPDIDIDIQDNKRELVVKYLFEKYGSHNVGLISTYQTLAAKSSLRDVARLMGISNGDATALTKLVPLDTNLDDAYKSSSRFRAAIDKSEEFTRLFELAKKIEGLPRQHGTHAAGIVLAQDLLTKMVPTLDSSDKLNQVQFSMDHLESFGLLKIDLLALRNLTILQSIQDEVWKNYQKKIDLTRISKTDSITNELLTSGLTNGIFQLESYGMKKTLSDVGVSSIDDVIAILSLYRPGPMDYIPLYAKRKMGKEKIEMIAQEYDDELKNTYGIIVYQEQIMKIAQKFAGMSFGQADILRRAIGKKNNNLIQSLKETFINGAISKGKTKDVAERVYSMIEKFADYGFNKSHAVAYATLSYRMAFLKARFPFEFYTAVLESSTGSLKSMQLYISEAKARGINVVAPNINISELFVTNKDKKIVLPLSIVKGLGGVANNKIIEERSKGAFQDFFDLVARLKINSLGEGVILSLIHGNALRDFGNMQTLIQALPQALRYAEMITTTVGGNKELNFSILQKPTLVEVEPSHKESSNFEKAIYGFNISLFATSPYEKDHRLVDFKENEIHTIPLRIKSIKKMTAKSGSPMALITAADSSTTIEFFVFGSMVESIGSVKKDTIVEAQMQLKTSKSQKRYNLLKPWEVING